MARSAEKKSRYEVVCAACNTIFRPGKSSPIGVTNFRYPSCSQTLEFVSNHDYLILMSSIVSGLSLTYILGYSGFTFVLISIGATVLMLLLITGVRYHIWPPKAQHTSQGSDVSMHLTEKPPD